MTATGREGIGRAITSCQLAENQGLALHVTVRLLSAANCDFPRGAVAGYDRRTPDNTFRQIITSMALLGGTVLVRHLQQHLGAPSRALLSGDARSSQST